ARAVRRTCAGHRARPVPDTDDAWIAAGGAGQSRRLGSLPQTPGQSERIRAAGAAHRRQPDAERGSDPPRRRTQNDGALEKASMRPPPAWGVLADGGAYRMNLLLPCV